jgi:hypothetical protein
MTVKPHDKVSSDQSTGNTFLLFLLLSVHVGCGVQAGDHLPAGDVEQPRPTGPGIQEPDRHG